VTLAAFQKIACMEEINGNVEQLLLIEEDHQIGNKPEIIDISTTDTRSRAELIESVQRAI
jgi:hypothetical protein